MNKLTDNRAVCLLSQMYLPHFDDEEKEALTMAINSIQECTRQKTEIEQKDIEIDILIRKKESLRDEICELQSEVERLKEFEYMYNDLLD